MYRKPVRSSPGPQTLPLQLVLISLLLLGSSLLAGCQPDSFSRCAPETFGEIGFTVDRCVPTEDDCEADRSAWGDLACSVLCAAKECPDDGACLTAGLVDAEVRVDSCEEPEELDCGEEARHCRCRVRAFEGTCVCHCVGGS